MRLQFLYAPNVRLVFPTKPNIRRKKKTRPNFRSITICYYLNWFRNSLSLSSYTASRQWFLWQALQRHNNVNNFVDCIMHNYIFVNPLIALKCQTFLIFISKKQQCLRENRAKRRKVTLYMQMTLIELLW